MFGPESKHKMQEYACDHYRALKYRRTEENDVSKEHGLQHSDDAIWDKAEKDTEEFIMKEFDIHKAQLESAGAGGEEAQTPGDGATQAAGGETAAGEEKTETGILDTQAKQDKWLESLLNAETGDVDVKPPQDMAISSSNFSI